jgi:DNA primase
MALIKKSSIDEVVGAADIVEVVAARTQLRRVGSRYTGRCPFHEERTPSFSVNAVEKLFYCFGCGKGGDLITFVKETEGLDFAGAVEWLADRYRVELEYEESSPAVEAGRRRRERLLALLESAAAFYGRYLWEAEAGEPVRAYLAARGLAEETCREFRLGLSPGGGLLAGKARAKGYTDAELVAAGLVNRRGNDYFGGRLVFPLADARGRVLGFGARRLADDDPIPAKYVNSPESELFRKAMVVYGLDRARAAIAKEDRAVVVEGYTDVLALHQAGLRESVAIMGTALTQEQLAELHRAAGTVLLALDADRSGQEAMLRAARAAQGRGLELLVVGLPDDRDPADLVAAEGAEGFEAVLGQAMSVTEFEVRRVLADGDLETAAGRDRALAAVRPLIATVSDRPSTRDELVRYVADRLSVPAAYLTDQLSAPVGGGRSTEQPGRASAEPAPAPVRPVAGRGNGAARAGADAALRGMGPSSSAGGERLAQAGSGIDSVVGAERAFLAMCLAEPRVGSDYLRRLRDEHLSSGTLRRARGHLARHPESPLSDLPEDDPALAAAVAEVAMRAGEEPSSEDALRLGFLQLDLRRIERELTAAGRSEDFERLRALWRDREEVRKRLAELMGEAF